MRRVKTAVIGTGFMGKVHSEAIRRVGNVDIAAVADLELSQAKRFADSLGIPLATDRYETILNDPDIEAVHVCAPNVLHYPISKAAIEAGKHVLCEKPLTMNSQEARDLTALAEKNGVVHCVNHNLRYYPVLQHVRRMIQNGDLGEVLMAQGTYYQDWLLYDTDYNWRVEARENGALRAMGDVGSHWLDMLQHLTSMNITSICADLQTFHTARKKPKHAVETFTGKKLKPEDYVSIPIETDDYGSMMFHMGKRARGVFSCSQMASGCKNRFAFEIFGTESGVAWNQERPDELWIGHRNTPNQIIIKDPSLLAAGASAYADLPGGHSEGYDDTHKQVCKRFYAKIVDPSIPVDYPTFHEGLSGMQKLEAVLESAKKRAWVDL